MKFQCRLTLLSLLCLSFSFFAKAQQKGDDLKPQIIDVPTILSPILADPVKVDFAPVTVKADTAKPDLKYSVPPRLLNLPFIPADIRPLAMVKDDKPATQNNYLKAGFGTQLTPYGELYLNTGRSNKYDAGLYAYHFSGSGDLDFQNFADNVLRLNAKKYFKSNSLSAWAGYNRNAVYYYGYDHGDTTLDVKKKDIKQTFTKFSGGLDLENTKKNKSLIDYDWHFGFYNLADNYHANESNFNTSLDLEKEYKKIHHFHFRFAADINSFKQDSVKTSANLFHISPWYRIEQENWKATVGFDVVVPTVGNPMFLPLIEGQYTLVDDYVIPFIGFKGYVNKNNFEQLSSLNPFINPYQPQTYDKKYDLYLGFKGSAGNHISYLLKVSERLYDNLPQFLPDSNRITRFNVDYQENAGELNFHGELAYREAEHINVKLGGDYYSYQLDFNDTVIGYPAGKVSLEADYNISDKILLGATIYTFSKSYTRLAGDKFLTPLNGYVDLNLSVQYNYKKNFGAFVNINNIASAKYQQWYRYPHYGFNLVAGLMLKF